MAFSPRAWPAGQHSRAPRHSQLAVRKQHTLVRVAGRSIQSVKSQSDASSEMVALKADLALLDASISSAQSQLVQWEGSNASGWEMEAAYKEQIEALTADIQACKQGQQDEGESAEVRQMLAKAENLREEAANLSLVLTERKAEIDSLRQQLSEFEESAEPLRAYALLGLRERGAESGGVAVLDRGSDPAAFKLPDDWSNDWSSTQLQRGPETLMPPSRPTPASVAVAAPEEGGRGALRGPGLPGLVLTAAALAIGRIWTALKNDLPQRLGIWLDLGAFTVMAGAAGYESFTK
ncbi:hypothetical protein WJX73_005913 [Symbiochloris irregularis]|uniref:Uncharacterized protein n=1 Tax=Symbiochloris irregularis TaxID=706552 RepID=A0AAW1NUM5_9CHLO